VEQLELGEIIGNVVSLKGGALHSMFKVETSSGNYAIKQLNPHITVKENFQKAYELSEVIAERMFKLQIPAVYSLSFKGSHVIQLEQEYFIIYPFIESHLLNDKNLAANHAQHIGSIFALMHSADIKLSGLEQAHYDYFDDSYWEKLIKKTKNPSLSKLLPSILSWNRAYAASISDLNNELVITHRDMHSQNVLWDTENQPHIVDWESAGLMNPMMEVIGYGLEWGGIILKHKVNTSFFETFITTYFQNLTRFWQTTPQQAFTGWLGHCVLAWTEFNIRRMLGEISSNDSEIAKGQEIIESKMIPCLNFIQKNERNLTLMVEKKIKNFIPK
jgi:Ser/Thr protein kinase RdoA (MazF antagonist)